MNADLLSFLLVLLIISMFLNLFFINSKLLGKVRDRRLEKQAPDIIKKFLSSQAYKTSNSHKFHYVPDLNGLVVKFRTAYLRIEEKCIDRKIDSNEYWNLLNSKLNELFKLVSAFVGNKHIVSVKKKVDLIKSLVKESATGGDKKKIYECLDRFYEVCDSNSNEKKLQEYDKKLNKIIMRFTDKCYARLDKLINLNCDYLDSGRGAIKGLEESAINMEKITEAVGQIRGEAKDTIEQCKSNSQQIKEGVNNVKSSLQQLEEKVFTIKDADEVEMRGEKADDSSEGLTKLSEEIQEQSEKEIARLRSVIDNQKGVILDLEEKISVMIEGLEAENAEDLSEEKRLRNQSLIDGLQANLRDAEYCISLLEQEVEALKNKSEGVNKEFERLSEKEVFPVEGEDVARLEEVVEDLKVDVESKSIENDLLKTVSEFSSEIFSGETYEDLSLLMYETIMAMGVNVVLRVYSPSRTFEVCASGKIPAKLSTVIDSLQINETSMGGASFFFKYKNFGGAISPANAGKLSDAQIEHVLITTGIADRMFDNIHLRQKSRAQLQKMDTCENTIKQTFSDVDFALDKINGNSKQVIESSFKQLLELAKQSGMNAAHLAKIRSLESNALDELNSENITRLKVKKAFLETLKQLEGIQH